MPEYKFTLPKGTVLRHKTGLVKSEEKTYIVEKVLGQGGFGITYLAYSIYTVGNIKQKMQFAIKELFVQKQCYRDEGDTNMRYSIAAKDDVEDCRKEFIAEARRLNHICKTNKHIVDVNEVFEANNTAYYVMEYLEGGNLRDMVSQNGGPLSERKALEYMLPIAEAVSMIHENYQLLHCDISPDNIMLRKAVDGSLEPVLIDFGVSLHFNVKGYLTTTHGGQGFKDGYSPQEQYGGIKEFDPRIDVYALTATLYYLLVGRAPKRSLDLSPKEIVQALPADLSESLQSAILQGMEKDKINRTATVRELISDIGSETHTCHVIPDELPVGFVLNDLSSGISYEIVSYVRKTPFFIHYKAVIRNAADDGFPGKTKKDRTDVYEFFDTKTQKRNEDRSVSTHGDTSDAEAQYVGLCEKKTRGTMTGAFISGSDYGWHAFEANGTHYLVLTHKRKPLAWEKMMETASFVGKALLGVAAVGGGIYLVALGWNAMSDYFHKRAEAKEIERYMLSQSLTRAIEQNNPDSLRYFAVDMDSARAFAPYAAICMEKGDTETAKKFAEKAGCDSIASRILAEIKEDVTGNTQKLSDAGDTLYVKKMLERIDLILAINKDTYNQNNIYSEYLDSLLQACDLHQTVSNYISDYHLGQFNEKVESRFRKLTNKIQEEYRSNLIASKNEFLPIRAKKACKENMRKIENGGKHFLHK